MVVKKVLKDVHLDRNTILKPEHVLSGNRIRLIPELKINAVPENLRNLTLVQRRYAKILDRIFFWWH